MVKILSDHGTHYFAPRRDYYGNQERPGRRKVRRYLCIGGPLGGLWRSTEELAEERHPKSYRMFNNAGGRNVDHSAVFLYDELFT